jgi:hypothetical protein
VRGLCDRAESVAGYYQSPPVGSAEVSETRPGYQKPPAPYMVRPDAGATAFPNASEGKEVRRNL